MVSVPLRAVPVLPPALKVIDPLPLPEVALVIVSQFALLLPVQPQPFAAVIVTVPVPPLAGTDRRTDKRSQRATLLAATETLSTWGASTASCYAVWFVKGRAQKTRRGSTVTMAELAVPRMSPNAGPTLRKLAITSPAYQPA